MVCESVAMITRKAKVDRKDRVTCLGRNFPRQSLADVTDQVTLQLEDPFGLGPSDGWLCQSPPTSLAIHQSGQDPLSSKTSRRSSGGKFFFHSAELPGSSRKSLTLAPFSRSFGLFFLNLFVN